MRDSFPRDLPRARRRVRGRLQRRAWARPSSTSSRSASRSRVATTTRRTHERRRRLRPERRRALLRLADRAERRSPAPLRRADHNECKAAWTARHGFAKAVSAAALRLAPPWPTSLQRASTRVREVLVAPGSSKLCGYDQSLLILTSNVPDKEAHPLTPRVDTEIAPKDQYSAVGYGGTVQSGGGAGQRRRRDNLFVHCANPTCPAFEAAKQGGSHTGSSRGRFRRSCDYMQHQIIRRPSRGQQGCAGPDLAASRRGDVDQDTRTTRR